MALAFGVYLAVSVSYFALPILGHLHGRYIGAGQDVQIFIWSLRWWPYALDHGLDPFYTHLVWAPYGADVTWTSSVPGISLLALPLTLTMGPTATWNILCVLTPAVTAGTAFLLCRRLTRSFSASLAGGFLFGFSSYELASMLGGHLHLALVFLLPLTVHLVLRYLYDEIRAWVLTACLTGVIALQFLISPEVFATATVFGLLALLAGWLLYPSRRTPIAHLGWPIAIALAGASALVSPLAVHMLTHVPTHTLSSPARNAADLANFVIPARFTGFGGASFHTVSRHFAGDSTTRSVYWGAPLLVVIAAYVLSRRRMASTRLLLLVVSVSAIAALGPALHIAHRHFIWLPGSLLAHVPVLANVGASRMIVYADLSIAISVSLWLAGGPRRVARWLLVAAAVVCLAPAAVRWQSTPDLARFIGTRAFVTAIHRGDTILTLPYAYRGDSMRAQAESGMYFRLMGGALQPTPAAESRYPIFAALVTGVHIAGAGPDFQRFLSAGHVREVVIDKSQFPRWRWLLSSLHSTVRRMEDAVVIAVPLTPTPTAPPTAGTPTFRRRVGPSDQKPSASPRRRPRDAWVGG